jgi:UDP-glucose 4-epimerase
VRVLVTGGAGYVGSVTVERLLAEGHQVTVLDSFLKGKRAAVPRDARLVDGDVADRPLLERTLTDDGIDAVLHCAGRSLVGESAIDPAGYFATNVVGGLALLDAMRATNVGRIVFSSSAAVYGAAGNALIEEDRPLKPVNPYGETKRAFEGALDWYSRAYDMAAVSLRYFNAAGASDERGEDHRPETHLIPNMIKAAMGGEQLKIFGTDYDTPDGTCIRDYIHVLDLADAHISALEMTAEVSGTHIACNLGSGSGFSVLEVLTAAQKVIGREVPHTFGPRREGDPPVLVASNKKAQEFFGWQPRRGTLDEMIGSAWHWHQAHPQGYPE